MKELTLVLWDWKESMDIEEIAEAIAKYAKPTIVEVRSTGTDACAAIVGERPMTPEEAQEAFDNNEWED